MQEVFEKIKERLEEEVKWQNEQATEEPPFCELTFEEARRKMAECYEHAIEIVNQVAEEFGNPERVDVPDINVGDNGWIPCSENLPKVYEDTKSSDVVLVCGYDKESDYSWQAMGFFVHTEGIKRWFFAECKDTNKPIDWIDIVAWQPLPEPYKEQNNG